MKRADGGWRLRRVTGICLTVAFLLVVRTWSFERAIGGYAEDYLLVTLPPGNRLDPDTDNLLHFRLNSRWYPWSLLALEASGRILCYGGRNFREARAIADRLGEDPGYLDLTVARGANGPPLVAFGQIDRLSGGLTSGNFLATLGRQRINWGTTLVWNPNDWFNAFNYLDFAYPEHPGADALRVQWYPGSTSVVELALQAGRTRAERTFAAQYKVNKWTYDWQFQAGLSGRDLASGFSWSGAIGGTGFRGEASWYVPVIDRDVFHDQTIVASIDCDYTFSNSLYLHGAALYNGFGTSDNDFTAFTASSRVNAKSLIPQKYALFGEIAYQLTPLMRFDLSSSVSPTDGSSYLSPFITLSVLDNLDLLALAQVFFGHAGDLYGDASDIVAINLKLSF